MTNAAQKPTKFWVYVLRILFLMIFFGFWGAGKSFFGEKWPKKQQTRFILGLNRVCQLWGE